MSEIKRIFDEIFNESSTNKKMEILGKYKDNTLLREVLYLANSKRVKFYVKQIPSYVKFSERTMFTNSISSLKNDGITFLKELSRREWTGNDAINELAGLLHNLPDDDAYIVERIIEKDCKIGMGTSNINKVFTELIEKTPYMGAKAYEPKLVEKMFAGGGVVRSDVKMDGRYCNILIRGGEVEAESRQGEPTILLNAKFLEELTTFKDCVLNGELTMDGVTRYESNGIISSLIDIQSKRESRTQAETDKKIAAFEKKHMSLQEALNSIRFTVWDTITIDEYFDKKSNRPLNERFRDLIVMLETYGPTMVSLIEHRFVSSAEQAHGHFLELLNRDLEGTILKAQDGTWKDGKPNWQIKYKLEMDIDLKIVGFNYGTGKNSELISSINAETSDGLLFTRPTGITEEMMQYITDNQDKLLGTILEVKCSGLSHDSSENYALLHPVFKGFRDDKSEANSLQEVKEIESAIKGLV